MAPDLLPVKELQFWPEVDNRTPCTAAEVTDWPSTSTISTTVPLTLLPGLQDKTESAG